MTRGDVVLVTATWREDLDRFRLLRRSLREFGLDEEFHHIVALHTEDEPHARDLHTDRNLEIVPTSRLLTRPIERRRAAAHYRRSQARHWAPGGPLAGWYVQQLTKLACLRIAAGARAIVYLDSDMVVIRPFHQSAFVSADGCTSFFVDGDMRADGSAEWNRTAARIVGVPDEEVRGRQFIHMPAVLDVASATAMLAHLSGGNGADGWQSAMLRANAFEFPTYGAWIMRTRGAGVVERPPLPALLFREYEDMWDFRARASEEIDRGSSSFLSVQSRLHIPPAAYTDVVARAWRRSA